MRRVEGKAKRQVYDFEVETVPQKPLEDHIPVVDGVLQNLEIQAVGVTVLLLRVFGAAQLLPWQCLGDMTLHYIMMTSGGHRPHVRAHSWLGKGTCAGAA